MPYLRARNAVILAKIESTEGTENAPAVTDAILVENPQLNPAATLITTNEVTGTLDGAGPIVGGMKMDLSFDVYLKGSGTAGTAPEVGDLLKACGWAEVITGTAVPASPEACAAGGSTTTAVLGTSASTTAQAYRGMPINFSGAVTLSTFISDYTAAKTATLTDTASGSIVATTNYQIPVNVLYKPASSSIPSLTIYFYMDGLLYKLVGNRGDFSIALDSGGVGRFRFRFSGMFLSKTDTSIVTPTNDTTRPPVFKNGAMLVNRGATALQNLSLECGNGMVNPDNPNALEGFDPAQITGRDMTGSMNPNETSIATRDVMADFRAGTKRIIHARFGTTTGNKVGLTIPQALYTGQNTGERGGLATVEVPFAATGAEAGAFLCFY